MTELNELPGLLLPWYRAHKRDLPWRREVTPYRVWVSEIMLQQTRVEAVKAYFIRFMEALPTLRDLAEAPEERLLKLWEGLGYYSRVRNLQKAAKEVMERYGGGLPGEYASLLKLPGIGSYTAGAVASIAFHLPEPAVDGNVLRVLSRILADGGDIADPAVKKRWETALRGAMPGAESGDYNQSLMELGATVCVPNGPPRCLECPVLEVCAARRQGLTEVLPVKSAKKPRRVEARTVLLLRRDERVGLRRRPDKGLLAGLWELPNLPGTLTQEEAVEAVRALGAEPLRIRPLPPAKHIFTHVEWRMTGFEATVEAPEGLLTWALPDDRREGFALPSAFRPFLQE